MNVFCLYIVQEFDKTTMGALSSKQGGASSAQSYFNKVLQKGQIVSNGVEAANEDNVPL